MTHETPTLRERIRNFFFAEEVPYGLAMVRMLLPLVLLIDMGRRWGWARELFSADGSPAQIAITYGWGNLFPEFSGTLVVAMFTALVFFLIATSIGWCTRFAVAASFVLYTYFTWMDAISSITKYTVIASHMLLILSVSHCGAVWSVDAWLARRRRNHWPGEPSVDRPKFAIWPRRLMQLMIGYVYFGAAITKMHTPAFFSGDQLLFWVNTHINQKHPIGEYFNFAPWLLGIFAYVSIVWEVLFLFLAWRGQGRLWMLSLGVCFHLGTTFIIGLVIFPLVCYCSYFAFANEEDVRWAAAKVRRFQRRRLRSHRRRPAETGGDWRDRIPAALRFPAPVAFALVAVFVAVAGVQAEYLMDPYGERRAEGRHQLKPIPNERVGELLLTGNGRIEPRDKLFAFDLGTITIGGVLANHRTEFRAGACLLAQCTFTPPHEDMWVQCCLYDLVTNDEGRLVRDRDTGMEKLGTIIDEQGHTVVRSELRTNFQYSLRDTLEPGLYAMVVKVQHRELGRRVFRVLPGPNTPSREPVRGVAAR